MLTITTIREEEVRNYINHVSQHYWRDGITFVGTWRISLAYGRKCKSTSDKLTDCARMELVFHSSAHATNNFVILCIKRVRFALASHFVTRVASQRRESMKVDDAFSLVRVRKSPAVIKVLFSPRLDRTRVSSAWRKVDRRSCGQASFPNTNSPRRGDLAGPPSTQSNRNIQWEEYSCNPQLNLRASGIATYLECASSIFRLPTILLYSINGKNSWLPPRGFAGKKHNLLKCFLKISLNIYT